ncbi:phage tail terminator family protein [Paenibacillus sp. KN14-4R]|uniref:phage tail terminator family protein n=1 Tax=Paenibacillus sp. KN14-4R TaxID=3445773 RepID=UPI003FA0024B
MDFISIRDSVIKVMKTQFPTAGVYGEEMNQVFKNGDFFVKLLDGTHSRECGRRYKRSNLLDIYYYHENNEQALKVAESLTEILEYITINGTLYRGTGIKYVFNANVLHFYVNYNYHLVKHEEESSKMTTLKQEGRINNEKRK